jgi:hypothetical protein
MSQSTTLSLRHATPRRNLDSIGLFGLDPACARSASLKAVWLHKPSRTSWAIPHVAARHAAPVAEVVVLTVRVPRAWLVRTKRGLWFCRRLIPADRIVSINPFLARAVSA